MKVLEGEGQADCIKSQLLQAPDNSVKVLRQTVIALAQVPRSCQACIEAEPAPASPVRARNTVPYMPVAQKRCRQDWEPAEEGLPPSIIMARIDKG